MGSAGGLSGSCLWGVLFAEVDLYLSLLLADHKRRRTTSRRSKPNG